MNLALIGYGKVGRAFARLLARKQAQFPFRVVGIHTARHGTATDAGGLDIEPSFGPPAASVEEFLDRSRAEVVFELTPLNPSTGEPAMSHIRAAFARGMHVVTANKGPVAHNYAGLRDDALRAGVQFRFESTVMDGAPVFNLVRETMPGVEVLGFAGVLNSTTNIVIEAMEAGRTLEEGVETARRLGIAESDVSYDLDGWDAAAKTAALANVLMGGRVTPLDVDTRGIRRQTPEKLAELKAKGKTVRLVSRTHRGKEGLKMRVRAEVLDAADTLATARGTSSFLLIETDLMGTLGVFEGNPGVEQTAYGLFSDLVDIARAI
ncbi:MAG: Homoserine dehydrogenase [Bryobacteraceae bacterium]|nr:Homoserine dehydrogenase [Bryobacteraceae bacterium]